MDERDLERGYAGFHRALNQILRLRDVKAFKRHVAGHPAQAGRLSHCLGLNDALAEVQMYKAIVIRPALKDLHAEALAWLKERGIEPPAPRPGKPGWGGRRHKKRGKRPYDRKEGSPLPDFYR